MKILFVDNQKDGFDRLLKIPFCREHHAEIEHIRNPMGLAEKVTNDAEVRLVILDILWEENGSGEALELGAAAMKELALHAPDVPVVIYSIIDDEHALGRLIPEMMRLGAYDWVSKDESLLIRSFRFNRAYMEGRKTRALGSKAVLAAEHQSRSEVHAAIMFVDLGGFTALTDEVGAAIVTGILKKFYKMVGLEVLPRNGYIDKYIGDAVMVAFGVIGENDIVSYKHVQQCIDAARHIQAQAHKFKIDEVEPVLRLRNTRIDPKRLSQIGGLRIGMESGLVEIVRFERGAESEVTFIGTPVNIASRILGLAETGETWAGHNMKATGLVGEPVAEKQASYRNLEGNFKIFKIAT
jgi:class 3 adenylate cyclase